MLKRVLLLGGAAVIGMAAAASALEDPVEARKEIMKNVGGASQLGGQMARGEAEFDPRVALLAFRTINAGITGAAHLFPEGTGEGDTRALPAVWEDPEDFAEKSEALRLASAEAIADPPQTLDEFRATFQNVAQNCGTCHETYRRPDS